MYKDFKKENTNVVYMTQIIVYRFLFHSTL